jgi:hypothetical protein
VAATVSLPSLVTDTRGKHTHIHPPTHPAPDTHTVRYVFAHVHARASTYTLTCTRTTQHTAPLHLPHCSSFRYFSQLHESLVDSRMTTTPQAASPRYHHHQQQQHQLQQQLTLGTPADFGVGLSRGSSGVNSSSLGNGNGAVKGDSRSSSISSGRPYLVMVRDAWKRREHRRCVSGARVWGELDSCCVRVCACVCTCWRVCLLVFVRVRLRGSEGVVWMLNVCA